MTTPVKLICFSVTIYMIELSLSNVVQCPYSDKECRNIECDETKMSKRAGYICDDWPYYSGGFNWCWMDDNTLCGDSNTYYYTCDHAIYAPTTNTVFCDFWHMQQTANPNDLYFCDCKDDNGKFCRSTICAKIQNFPYDSTNKTREDNYINKVLLTNVEIYGVHPCGYFEDPDLIEKVPKYCYEYDDFTSCYCIEDQTLDYCPQWVCHDYKNKEQGDLDVDLANNTEWSQNEHDTDHEHQVVAKQMNTEKYHCIDTNIQKETLNSTSMIHDSVNIAICQEWKGDITYGDQGFSVQSCECTSWNSNNGLFGYMDIGNLSSSHELIDSFCDKWQCQETGMDNRHNEYFVHFWLSTIMWSVGMGGIVLVSLFFYMKNKYMTLSSFFCVQTWFLFIFGTAALLHGGTMSFVVYFIMQILIIFYILYQKWKNRNKKYYTRTQRYDFEQQQSDLDMNL